MKPPAGDARILGLDGRVGQQARLGGLGGWAMNTETFKLASTLYHLLAEGS